MPHTPLIKYLRRVASVAAESIARKVPADQILEEREQRRLDRRDFLKTSAKILATAGTALVTPRAFAAGGSSGRSPDIVIIGGGLAGLTCAYRLKKAGIRAKVFEAAHRLGGRCVTRRGYFEDAQLAERGGELIDTGHFAIRKLAREFHLKMDDLLAAEPVGTEPCYYFDGMPYSFKEATHDFRKIFAKLQADVEAAPFPTLFDSFTPRAKELDQMSIIDWLNESVPGGANSKFGQLLTAAYTAEYGSEADVQSSLNLLYLLGFSPRRTFQIFGESDERFHIRGGNDLLVTRLVGALEDQIQIESELVAIVQRSDGSFSLTLKRDGQSRRVTADKVVLALPFSILRRSVDFSRAGFSDLKQIAIREQGMGTNSKMQVQFTSRHWHSLGCNGETFADTGYQDTWDASRTQRGDAGLLVDFAGGNAGLAFNQGSVKSRAKLFLNQIEPLLPGLSEQWNDKALLSYWPGYRWTRGSYSFWKVGQYTQFVGIEGRQEGNCHFAGEHTSIDFQGFLNGAVDSGGRAADEILTDLGTASFQAP